MKTIAINCDMGEGSGHDEELMPLTHLASIACGGHAGNEQTIRDTIHLAQRLNKRIGAHISFIDREGFGRQEQQLSARDLYTVVRMQLVLFMKVAKDENALVFHVKPHGALYNMAARDAGVASVVADAIKDVNPGLTVLALSNSEAVRTTRKAGLAVWEEVFADRRYCADGSLMARSRPEAVLTDEAAIRGQVSGIVNDGWVITGEGSRLPVAADTICVHGDGAGAVAAAGIVYAILNK